MRWRSLIISLLVVAAGIAVAIGLRQRFTAQPGAIVLPVPEGDREIAWFNPSTGGLNWERFIVGIQRARSGVPGLEIDVSRAFLERSTAIPEVVLSWKDRPGKLHIRWYKQTGEIDTKQWIDALAERNPPPLAIIGGGTSDRARDLARELNDRTQWKGTRPLFLITTATANEVGESAEDFQRKSLLKFYPDRSFRFCFTNEQMASAVVDFVWSQKELQPRGGAVNEEPFFAYPIHWEDDPYSIDLSEKFRQALNRKAEGNLIIPFNCHPSYSVGSFDSVNRAEVVYTKLVLDEPLILPEKRSLLIIPTSTAPARRFIRALTGELPMIGRHLVALNGDAISLNDVYRDGAMNWNHRDLPVPLVFFSHYNPIGWDRDNPPPTSTDDVLLTSNMIEVLSKALWSADGTFTGNADDLRDRIRSLGIFDSDGNRREGEEYVIYLKPIFLDERIEARAELQVWRRLGPQAWVRVPESANLFAPYVKPAPRRADLGS